MKGSNGVDGQSLQPGSKAKPLVTRLGNCQRDDSVNIEPGAWMLVYCYKTGKFLLGKRSTLVRKAGLWDFFGGHLNPGESPRAAVLRELAEETGLTPQDRYVRPLGEVGMSTLGYAVGLRELHYYLIFTEQELIPKLGPEHTDYHWFEPHDLPKDLNRPSSVAVEIGLIHKTLMLAEHLGLR